MLLLGENSVTFDGDSLSDIFYDDVNSKICTVRGNGTMGITLKGHMAEAISFRTRETAQIKTIKFSPNGRIASIQRDDSTVDFVFLSSANGGGVNSTDLQPDVKQRCKLKNAIIIGLEWVSASQILYILNTGLELYQVNSEKKTIKLIRSFNIALIWFVYYPKSQLLIVSSGINGALLNPFLIQNGSIHKLCRFEVDFGCSNAKSKLLERDVTIGSIYGTLYVLVLRSSIRDSTTSDIALYELSGDPAVPSKFAYSLTLGLTGMFGVHVIDSLVIVHHQISCKSFVFDIGLDLQTHFHRAIVEDAIAIDPSAESFVSDGMELYTPAWVIFAPNFIIDSRAGIFTTLRVVAEQAVSHIKDNCTLLRFLMNRRNAKKAFLNTFTSMLSEKRLNLVNCSSVFSLIVNASVATDMNSSTAPEQQRIRIVPEPYQQMKIEQSDLLSCVFLSLKDITTTDKKFLVNVMLECLLALNANSVDVEPYFHEVLVNTMVEAQEYSKLQQLLQYRVIADAKPLAFNLLSLEVQHAPLIQLAVDMLARLGVDEQIVEVLLSKGKVIEAVRFIDTVGLERFNCLKAFEAALKSDRVAQYAIFSYFHDKKRPNVGKESEYYDMFKQKFDEMYSAEELQIANKESIFGDV
ncbi:hypothetical protein QR680_005474 [Steinernema hermaphroditum]|uniref:Mic1 domain-containing protein n=1 Tax=Steinernema hermaphroditum TaxID=289476 RepID=A0AA39HT84_9BILA|nr:hypothetical protein QR680_005474 [Steinernema hermaphroditum]